MSLKVAPYFCILIVFGKSLQLTDDLPIGTWNEITIKPGRNSFSFGIATDPSRFLAFSIHSPFNKIWASLLEEFPVASSQYGYNLGLVNRERVTNASQILFVHSFHSQPLLAAVRASLYDAESAIPGGCGIDSTDRFSASTIITSWEGETSYLLDDTPGNSSERLRWWTSTLRFYAASSPQGSADACPSGFQANASSIVNLVYHIYHIPLVTSGGSGGTYVSPSTGDVLCVLNRLSSYGDAALRGTLVASINAKDLRLYGDNSYEVKIARHLGTASAVNVIAEYKTGSRSQMESSTFVAYAPTVLYTCPHTDEQSFYRIYTKSDQLTCDLFSGISTGTRFSIGIIFLAALLYALSGSYFVWLRCGTSIAMMSSFICLMVFYRYSHLPDSVMFWLFAPFAIHLVVVGVLIPIFTSCLLMFLIYCCCIRKFYVQDTVPLSPSIFNPLNEPQLPFYSSYGAIGDVDDGRTNGGSFADHFFPERSSHLRFPRSHSNFTFGTGEGIYTATTTLKNTFCCCCYSRRSNQYRLWRLARLVPVLPAVLLLTSLFVGSLLNYIDALKNPPGHICFFVFIYIVLIALMYIYKNMAFGLSVALTGLYIGLNCVALLFFPNSLLPYILVDEFLILTWPEERLSVHDISVYGRNDTIFLVVWLSGSVLAGLITLCALRLSDSRDHNASRGQAAGGLCEPLMAAPTGAVVTTTSRSSHWWPLRQRLFQYWRRDRRRNRGPFTAFDEMEVTAGRQDEEELEPSVFTYFDTETFPPPYAPVEENRLQTNIAWPPQPLTDRPLAPVLPAERRAFLDRQRPMYGAALEAPLPPPPLIPMSRTQLEAAAAAPSAGPTNKQTSPCPCHTTRGRNPFDVDVEEDRAFGSQDLPAPPRDEPVEQ
uniref:Iron sulfur cluster assembly 2 n=1 Tax=Echinococcus granulosus TaxID=6210 RepID=A0A068WN85_ECHGR|nr:iron sulfur cluster assembly 2 [Echinococcus granulosus]